MRYFDKSKRNFFALTTNLYVWCRSQDTDTQTRKTVQRWSWWRSDNNGTLWLATMDTAQLLVRDPLWPMAYSEPHVDLLASEPLVSPSLASVDTMAMRSRWAIDTRSIKHECCELDWWDSSIVNMSGELLLHQQRIMLVQPRLYLPSPAHLPPLIKQNLVTRTPCLQFVVQG